MRRGKRLVGPPDAETTRPIPDMVKEAVFNLLRGHCEGATVFDGFAGTGSIGLEAVSRGAERVVCVERDRKIAGVLKRNIDNLGFGDRVTLVVGDVLASSTLSKCPAALNLIFFDPPYPLVRDPEGWRRVTQQFARLIRRLEPDGFAVIRTPHPFVFLPEEEQEPDPRGDRGRAGHRRGTGSVKRHETRSDVPEPDEDEPGETIRIDLDEAGDEGLSRLDEFEAALAAGAGAPAPPPKPIDADLEIDAAEGPETHTYGSTAVHLYMRALDPGHDNAGGEA